MNEEQLINKKLHLHLKYIVVIFILVSSTVGGMALYNQDLAIKSLSAASLLTSIVLAVVAILITLWDVAGQKSNILSMQENLKSFNEIIEEFQNISTQNEISINELKDLISEMNENVISYESKFVQIEKKIEESGNDALKGEIEEIRKQRNYNIHKEATNTNTGIDLRMAENFVKSQFLNQEKIPAKKLMNEFSSTFDISLKMARQVLDYFENRNLIKKDLEETDEYNGKYKELFYYLA